MSFSDPFNRASHKREKEYAAFQEQLKQAGVDSEEKAVELLKNSGRRMVGFGIFVIVVTFPVSMVWPDQKGVAILCGGLVLTWLLATMLKGRRMIKRFIQEELTVKQ